MSANYLCRVRLRSCAWFIHIAVLKLKEKILCNCRKLQLIVCGRGFDWRRELGLMQYSPLFNIVASYTVARIFQKLEGFKLEYISIAFVSRRYCCLPLSLALSSLTWYSSLLDKQRTDRLIRLHPDFEATPWNLFCMRVCVHVGEKHANIRVRLKCVQKGEVFAFGALFGSAPS